MKNKQKYIRDFVCLHPTQRFNVVVETRIDNNNGWWGIPPIITNMLCNDITNVQKGKGSLPTKIVIVKIVILLYLLYSENHNL